MSDVTRALYKDQFGSNADATQTAKLNPAYNYLRIQVSGSSPALLVLGYVDAHPQGDIEVWYSANSEVIRTQNGRIVGTAGLALDWRNVRFANAPPSWAAASMAPQSFARVRDESQGYRYGIQDQLTLEAVAGVPAVEFPQSLPLPLAQSYRWYRESSSGDGNQALPVSWFAVGRHQGHPAVVFSFQCLAPQFCLSLQRWPLEKEPT